MKRLFYAIAFLCIFLIVSISLYAQTDADFDRAVELYGKGKFEQVVDILTKYVERKPEPAANWLIGYSLYKLGRHDEADDYFKDAYLIDPDFSPKQIKAFAPAEAEKAEKELQKALEEFEKPITIPEKPKVTMPSVELPPAKEVPQKKIPVKPSVAQKQIPAPQQKPSPPPQPEVVQKEAPTPPAVTPQEQPPVTKPVKPMPKKQVRPPVQQPFQVPEDFAAIALLFAGFGLIILIITAVLYVYFSLCFFFMAKKLGIAAPWLAFIPIVQIWTFVAVAGKQWWWILLLFIPLVGAILTIYLWMCISENMGKNKWLGLLILVPIVQFILPGYLAFSKAEKSVMEDLEPFDMEEELE